MPRDAAPPPAGDVGADGRRLLAAAFTAYFEELDEAWGLCERHDTSTRVKARAGLVELVKQVRLSADLAAALRAAAERLPPWERSPHWAAHRAGWDHALRRVRGRQGLLYARGASWEGRPIIVAVARQRGRNASVSLALPPVDAPWPESELRRVAAALRCVEFLLPPADARVAPRHPSGLPLREHLTRATPEGSAARKCISARRA